MKRDIVEKLIAWKSSAQRKPLMLTGVRQCGKTYILQSFGREFYKSCAYINFEQDNRFLSVFDMDLNPQRIVQDLRIMGLNIIEDETLLILDEVQQCPRAITSLKYFCEQIPNLHIAVAGSLLGVSLNRDGISFPVGKVDRLTLYPMSFREFVVASGKENLLSAISTNIPIDAPLPEHYTQPLETLLREYYAIGGMPACVKAWIDTKDISVVETIQKQILSDYQNDFAKHAPSSDIPKLGWIWDSVPVQLAKENNKFVFSHVRQGKRSAELEDALRWLVDAGLIYRLTLAENIEVPISCFVNDSYFKVYMVDVGLMRAKIGLPANALWQDSSAFHTFKGAFTENYVMTELVKLGITPYFWRSQNSAELDFLFQHNGIIIPMESKAEINTKAKTYSSFCQRFNPSLGFKVSMKNVALNLVSQTSTYSLPLYTLWRLPAYVP